LPQAEAEVSAIAEVVGIGSPATVLRGPAATVDAVLDGMERAGLVHIAAHGRFRADNPMFSSLQLADGLLYVHDLDRLQRTPHTVVLTACSAARAGVYGGDELLGTSVALLALGVRSVVAPLLPVRDDSAMTLAVELHRQLRDRDDVPTAVAAAVRTIAAGDDPGLLAAATSMLCISRRIP
jgi:CHAT domain-containing protein